MSGPNFAANHRTAYRRGVVLGLTMAELSLFLVFALMLTLASQVRQSDDNVGPQILAQAAADDDQAPPNATEIAAARAMQQLTATGQTIDDTFRRLVRADGIVQTLQIQGIDVVAMLVETNALAATQQLRESGFSQAQVQAALELLPLLTTPGAEADIEDDFRRLRRAEETLIALERSGIDVGALTREPEAAREVQRIRLAEPNVSIDALVAALNSTRLSAGRPEAAAERESNWPPIISLSEADGYFFDTNSAAPNLQFLSALSRIVIPRIVDIITAYDVNVIEVIGHTDERYVNSGNTNLDYQLLQALNGGAIRLTAADNAGLGLARATAVAAQLMADPRLAGYTIIPLSAGQLVDIDGHVTEGRLGDIPERRRIEIRLRREEAR